MNRQAADIYLVTGASRGIGAALAAALDARGASLFLVARGEIDNHYADAVVHRTDLSDPANVAPLLAAFADFVAARDAASLTLVNNAGTLTPVAPAGRCEADAVTTAVQLNLLAPMLLTGGFIAAFAGDHRPRRVVNISSGAASSAYAGWNTYCATKAGLDHFTRCVGLEQEQAASPVMVIALAPGVVDTDMQAQIRASREEDFPMLGKFVEFKSSGKLPGADEVARGVVQFLEEWPLEHGGVYDLRSVEVSGQ